MKSEQKRVFKFINFLVWAAHFFGEEQQVRKMCQKHDAACLSSQQPLNQRRRRIFRGFYQFLLFSVRDQRQKFPISCANQTFMSSRKKSFLPLMKKSLKALEIFFGFSAFSFRWRRRIIVHFAE